ncbi:MAG: diguanylate cyclase [Acidovorax sp.]|uniref:GGDEF domain-containing protein n=1 Tax=Acidovorax sp. TaxID=1872122 RepID=UPI0039E3985B
MPSSSQRDEPAALLTAVPCVAGGLGLLAWAATDTALGTSARTALAVAGLALVAAGYMHWRLARRWQARAARALQDAERAERRLREAMDAMPAGLEIYDEQDRLVLCNAHMARLRPHLPLQESLGKTYEELLREGLRHGIPEEASGQEELWLAHELAARGHRAGPEVLHYPGGAWMHVHERRTPSGMTVCVRLDITDLIAQRQKAEAARQESQRIRQLLERAVEALPMSIEIYDAQDRLVLYNQQLSRMYPHVNYAEHLGHSFESILRHSVAQGLIPSATGREEAWLAERLAEHGNRTSTLVQRLADGRWINIYETRTPENYVVAVRLDITDLIAQRQALELANEKLALLSTTDGVTNIGNRRRFDERLATEWQRCGRHQSPLAVVLIDIDHFKLYNDHYGHLAGDECLRRVAQMLQATIRRADEVAARYGGEEFALLLPDAQLADAVVVARRCMDGLRAADIAHPHSPTAPVLTLSIGVACLVPRAGTSADTLVRAADAALYSAKYAGRNRMEVFAPPQGG